MAVASTSARTIAICDQPTSVMASPSSSEFSESSEFFGVDQRVQEVDSEADSDDQADDGLGHCDSPYNLSQAWA
jgi:hypothetical protein